MRPIWCPESLVASRFLENLCTPVVSFFLDFNDDNFRAGWKSLFYLLYTILLRRSHETSIFNLLELIPLRFALFWILRYEKR